MFARLANFVTRHWLAVLVGWPVILLLVHWLATDWNSLVEDGESAYLPGRMSSVRGVALIKKAFPKAGLKSQDVVVAARSSLERCRLRGGGPPRRIATAGERCEKPGRLGAQPRHAVGRTGTNQPAGRNGQATLILLNLRTEMAAVENMGFIRRLQTTLSATERESTFPAGLELAITGASAINANVYLAAEQSLRNTEWTTIALVVLILAAVYHAWGLVVVPLLCIFVAWVLSIDLLSVAADLSRRTEWYDSKIFRTSKIFIVVMLFGAATDYCLFLIARCMEGLRDKLPSDLALQSAVADVGSAITASAMATILGLCSLLFAEFGRYRYGGPTIAFSLLVALAACLTLAPALLRAGGRALFWPLRRPTRNAVCRPSINCGIA